MEEERKEESKYALNKENNLPLHAQNKRNKWYVDSGCSKHMTDDKSKFSDFMREKGGSVTFENDGLGKIIGKGIVQLGREEVKAKDVLLARNMKIDLLSVSQMCDQ